MGVAMFAIHNNVTFLSEDLNIDELAKKPRNLGIIL